MFPVFPHLCTKILIALACLLLGTGVAQAQQPYTPQPGSLNRAAILNAARAKVAADLDFEGRLRFVVKSLRVSGDWALLLADPRTPSGAELRKHCPGADEITLVLLKRSEGTWYVERGGSTCATDVFWLKWPSEVGAPEEIFALDEKNGTN